MSFLMMAFIALIILFGGGMVIVLLMMNQGGSTMNTPQAAAFEVYRYAVCFVSVLIFGMMSHSLLHGLVRDYTDANNLAVSGAGVLIAAILFVLHWKMTNPALASGSKD